VSEVFKQGVTMTDEKEQVINIDGQEHKVADLTQEQRYLVMQVQNLQAKEDDFKFKIDQVIVAKNHFINTLKDKLNEDKEDG
jgi:hypothetical protein